MPGVFVILTRSVGLELPAWAQPYSQASLSLAYQAQAARASRRGSSDGTATRNRRAGYHLNRSDWYKKMRLTFVRHAESVGNAEERLQGRAEFELSEAGRAQARALRDRFNDEEFQPTHIYSSPQKRTAETAEIVSTSWPLAISYWDDLKEYDIGAFSGLTWPEIAGRYPDVAEEFEKFRDWDLVEGAETFAQRKSRGGRVVESLLDRRRDNDRVLVFTHGGILQHIIASLLGTGRTWGLGAHNTGIFDFSLDVERWSNDGDSLHNPILWRISRFNDASHLSTLG